jgi:uncharacterized membrane protein YdfJ with MMPL/SSD domain
MRSRKKAVIFAVAIIIAVAVMMIVVIGNQSSEPDATSSATVSVSQSNQYQNTEGQNVLIILYSGSEGNTRKLANVFANELNAVIYEPGESGAVPED